MNAGKITAIVALFLSFLILSGSVQAYSGGDGSPGNPYQIASVANLLDMTTDTGNYDTCFILTADINLASAGTFTGSIIARDTNNTSQPFDGTVFAGVFDGNGHTISNLTIVVSGDRGYYTGLFGKIGDGGQIKNLRLENVNITGGNESYYIGGLVGYNDGSTITNCFATGTVSGGGSGGDAQEIGGLVGSNHNGNISDCNSAVSVSTTGYEPSYLGSLVGFNDNGDINNCCATGNVAGGYSYLGGLAGLNQNADISNCFATGNVSSGDDSEQFGGLVGSSNSSANIRNCYAAGNVTGGDYSYHLGGLIGMNDSTVSGCYSTGDVNGGNESEFLGGLTGRNEGATSNCYSTGTVTGGTSAYNIGGLVGYNHNNNITRCYSTGNVSGSSLYQVGGLAGWNNSNISNCYSTSNVTGGDNSIGGLVGDNYGSISNCYSTGDVSGNNEFGGLVGYNEGDVNSCYFLDTEPNNGLGTPLTDAQMKQQASFTGWDFDDVWLIYESISYPRLSVFYNYAGGSGTADDPYQIAAVYDLLALAGRTADYGKYFILTADIDLDPNLPGNQVFTTAIIAPDTDSINNYDFDGTAFTGVFDGNNHTISNMTIDTGGAGNDFLGLFGYTNGAQIKNLGIKNVSITSGDTSLAIGGLAGYNYDSSISNCYVTGNVSGGGSSFYIGGLAGENEDGNISDCFSTAAVTAGNSLEAIGGLVGGNMNGGDISNCYSTNSVSSGDNSYFLGGLVGENYGNISNCFSTCSVTGVSHAGGLAGYNSGHISASCSTGSVTGPDNSIALGGLIGRSGGGDVNNCCSTGAVTGGDNSQYLGGLMGLQDDGAISHCYSAGAVSNGAGSTCLGGLVGLKNSGSVSDCFFLTTSGPDNNVPGATPLTDKQMKQQKSFVGWDFVGETANGTEDIWWINKGASYPKLTWQLNVDKCTVTAGSKPNTDKISFSGTMGASADDFNDANAVRVTINSDDIINPCIQTFPIDANTFKKGKYNYSKTVNGVKKSFTYDTKTRKFSFSASNLSLSGLGCLMTVEITVGGYAGSVALDEAIVNAKMPLPIQLMTGVKNVLRVDKCTVKKGKKLPNTDQLTASGGFTVANPDPNMNNWITDDLVVTLGTQTFTVPAVNLKTGKGKFSCTKAVTDTTSGGDAGVVAATFDFNKCSFTLTIKNTAITATGDVDFGVSFAAFDETDNVTLP
jgi:hypothetical protein